ncbi:B-box domain protein 30-like [Syzygium oleosum]|uniref:B-box domain protein 30-like n=1 Tax=Syzygium oleosum TaxID=219896 RepID=UPI0011D1F83D|nr:B-box domain protein 30-like [Syzygium oleosum]
MCRGIGRENSSPGGSFLKEESPCKPPPNKASVACELCGSRACLYCQADDAYLCRQCDRWVHEANFLAQRHIRCLLCNTCQRLTQRYVLGPSTVVVLPSMVENWADQRDSSDAQDKSSGNIRRPFLFL